MPGLPDIRQDMRATIEARRDLGPEYEAALVESFVERLDATHRPPRARRDARRRGRLTPPPPPSARRQRLVPIALGSMGIGIPLTAIAARPGTAGPAPGPGAASWRSTSPRPPPSCAAADQRRSPPGRRGQDTPSRRSREPALPARLRRRGRAQADLGGEVLVGVLQAVAPHALGVLVAAPQRERAGQQLDGQRARSPRRRPPRSPRRTPRTPAPGGRCRACTRSRAHRPRPGTASASSSTSAASPGSPSSSSSSASRWAAREADLRVARWPARPAARPPPRRRRPPAASRASAMCASGT